MTRRALWVLASALAFLAPSVALAQAATPRPLPAVLHVRAHLPGPDAGRHLDVQVDIGRGAEWTIEGCVSSGGGCRRTRRVTLGEADRAEYVRLWTEIRATPRCEPEGIFPGERVFVLDSPDGRFEGRLPASVDAIIDRNRGPCRAHARMAWWVAQVFSR